MKLDNFLFWKYLYIENNKDASVDPLRLSPSKKKKKKERKWNTQTVA